MAISILPLKGVFFLFGLFHNNDKKLTLLFEFGKDLR